VTAHLGRERQGPATGTIGWRTARCQVGDNGFVELTLLSSKGFKGRREGEEGHADEGERYVGVIAIAIAPSGDQVGRQRIIDQIVPEG
jgi:hypothetical protein